MTDIDKVFFKVEGMVERGGFTWMGWPDAVVASLEGTEGIQKIVYLTEKGVFELRYIPSVISLNNIFEKIKALGKERKLPYKGLIIPMK